MAGANNQKLFSADDERWPLAAALTWIATRSVKFAEAFAARDIFDADAHVASGRIYSGIPPGLSYGDAFVNLCGKITGGEIRGRADRLKWRIPHDHEAAEPHQYFALASPPEIQLSVDFRPRDFLNRMGAGDEVRLRDFAFHDGDCVTPKGTGYGSPNADGSRFRWSWRGVTFARDDLFRLWPDWLFFAAWKMAKARPWRPPNGFSPGWLNRASSGLYEPLAEVVSLLAFGREASPLGLDACAERAARLRAGLVVLSAAADGNVSIVGRATFRLPHFPGALGPLGALQKIEPAELRETTLVVDGAHDWIGPRRFADEYPEQGQAAESITYADVIVHRASAVRWFAEVSNRPAPQKRGRKPAHDWPGIEAEAMRLMDYHGEFSADDEFWNAQARLESALMDFCARKWDREPSIGRLRHHLAT